MFKDLYRLTKLFAKIYWLQAIIWTVVQVIVIVVYRKLTIVTSIGEPIPTTPPNSIIVTLAGIFSFSFMILLMFLGNTFSSAQRANWLRQLPFRTSSLNLLPLTIICAFGLCLLFFIPWGAFKSGISVFTIGIPIAVFLTLKNSRHYIIGLFKSAGTGIALILMWIYFFYDWSVLQPMIIVEAVALIVISAIWLILGREERRYTLFFSAILLALLVSTTAYIQNRTPQNFSQATLDHAFFPTEKTWEWFKKIALDANYWNSVDQFGLPSYVRYRSQDFIEKFSDSEKITFIENIERNRVKWNDAKLPEYRPMRFASFVQPEIRFSNYSNFPIGRNNVSDRLERYLYSNWKNSRLFCQLLPQRRTKEFVEKLFLVEDCGTEFFNHGVWSLYSLIEYSDFEREFDRLLLEAHEKSPSKTRSNLMSFMISGWGLYEVKKKYDDYRQVIFNQKPLSSDLLEQMKKDRFRESLKFLKAMSHLDQNAFLKEVKGFYLTDNGGVPLLFLSEYLHGDGNAFLNSKKSETVSLPEAWYRRLHALSLDDTGMWVLWMKEEIAKPENWSRIEQLMKYANDRQDL